MRPETFPMPYSGIQPYGGTLRVGRANAHNGPKRGPEKPQLSKLSGGWILGSVLPCRPRFFWGARQAKIPSSPQGAPVSCPPHQCSRRGSLAWVCHAAPLNTLQSPVGRTTSAPQGPRRIPVGWTAHRCTAVAPRGADNSCPPKAPAEHRLAGQLTSVLRLLGPRCRKVAARLRVLREGTSGQNPQTPARVHR